MSEIDDIAEKTLQTLLDEELICDDSQIDHANQFHIKKHIRAAIDEVREFDKEQIDKYSRLLSKREHKIGDLEAENERLAKFARRVIKSRCWGEETMDGGDIQELAEELGLIYKTTATKEDVDPEHSDYEVGDTIYKFTDALTAQQGKE
ncbi:MAG: hypothetical protein PVJ60_03950 [Phycisphaerales bacterium]|jgi:hypothetical protein